MMSEDFHKFIDRSTRLTERTLCEMSEANLFVDYTGGFADDDSEGLDGDKSGGGVKLSMNRCFYEEKSTKNRVVTSMDWSTVFPELLLASYDKSFDVVHDSGTISLKTKWET
jgi:dynein intermediate chain